MRKTKRPKTPKPKVCPKHGRMRKEQTSYGWLWVCGNPECDIQCWDGPTSTPADGPTRSARARLHAEFDVLWRDEKLSPFVQGHRPNVPQVRRSRAYRWLSEQLGLDIRQTHIGQFDRETCTRALEIVLNFKKGLT